ncbi:hypothetical protein TYRP_004891 [Tyrophagus putrescentiae]|nr:hypothetical protein TYRP_004891 [Tyrophagus putrescentiae]
MKHLLVFALLAAAFAVISVEAVLYPIEYRLPLDEGIGQPSPADVWPKPRKYKYSTSTQFTLDKAKFQFSTNLASCDIIKAALARYTDIIFLDSKFHAAAGHPLLQQVVVVVAQGTAASCGYPSPSEDESYSVKVPTDGAAGVIEAQTVWGALRGLETFSQLVYADAKNQLLINETEIEDGPRYRYRGLLLDTARHYLPKKILLANLDAMAYNKLNAFHWHLVDDQSFPFVSQKYPTIHQKGAYTPKHVYTPADVQEVIEYARMRGIRVIPEMDTPGHTHAMARAYPELLTPCYKNGKVRQPDYPNHSQTEILNPASSILLFSLMRNETFSFMKDIYAEFKKVFKDPYIHLGMDEVFYSCWKSSPDITKFMQTHGFKEYHEVEEYYTKRTLTNVKDVGYKYIIWQDPGGQRCHPWRRTLSSASGRTKYQIILSACWYLNYITTPYPGKDWEVLYQCDPRNFNGTEAEKDLVIGGQANIWGEFVDKTNVLGRLWPRASAVAERLWSEAAATTNLDTARLRLDVQRCRMLRRGIPAAPILNGYCGEWEVPADEKVDVTKRVKLNFD